MTSTDLWPAPTAASPLDALVELPGSKSLTNRALILAALADRPSVLRRPLQARDTRLMVEGLRALGALITEDGDELEVEPGVLRGPARVDCGLAGTVMRFLPPVAALADGDTEFDGDPRARERPMRPVLDALRDLGAEIDDGGRGLLPFVVRGRGRIPGGKVTLDASSSSQFLSALLLAAPRFDDGVTVRHAGGALPSLPHVAMSIDVLRSAGVEARQVAPDEWRVDPGPIRPGTVDVEPDLSNAAPFLAAALVAGGTVRMPHWPSRSTQPGIEVPDLLARMGGDVDLTDGVLSVGSSGSIHGLDEDLRDVGELTPTLAALAALADSPSVLRGIAHLRGHETDRLAALRSEINSLGGAVTERPDGLEISPRPLHGGRFETYHDHRMATAGALLGLAVPGIEVVDIDTTAKTLPDFPRRWAALLGDDGSEH